MSEHKVELVKDLLLRAPDPVPEPVAERLALLLGGFLGDVSSIARSLETIAREAERDGRARRAGR